MNNDSARLSNTPKITTGLLDTDTHFEHRSPGWNNPDVLTNEQQHTLYTIHEHMVRILSISLSDFLRQIVEVKIQSFHLVSYLDFIHSLPSPCSIHLVNMDPLDGKMMISCSPSFSAYIVDRLCGGSECGALTDPLPEPTEIELSILEKALYRLFDVLHEAWAYFLPLNVSLEQTETLPVLLENVYGPQETCIIISLSVWFENANTGTIDLCFPHVTLKPIEEELISPDAKGDLIAFIKSPSEQIQESKRMTKTLTVHTQDGTRSEHRIRDLIWQGDFSSFPKPTTPERKEIICIGEEYTLPNIESHPPAID